MTALAMARAIGTITTHDDTSQPILGEVNFSNKFNFMNLFLFFLFSDVLATKI